MIKADVKVNSDEHFVFNGGTKDAFLDGYLYVIEGFVTFILAKPMKGSDLPLYTGIKKAVVEIEKTGIKFTKPMQKVYLTAENKIADTATPVTNIHIGYCLRDEGNEIIMLMA